MTSIDMQTMRYINLLDRASRVKTTKCFVYNNIIIFAVPRALISRAIGPNASNVKDIQDQLGKRVKIISEPTGIGDAENFVRDIVSPVSFKSLEVKDGMFVLTAGSQSKASLIGRNKRRLEELEKVVKDIFAMSLKIV